MSVMKHVGLFLLPVSITAVGTAWYLDLFAQEGVAPAATEIQAQATNALVELKPMTNFESLSYPEEPQLAQLQREWYQQQSSHRTLVPLLVKSMRVMTPFLVSKSYSTSLRKQ